MALNKLLLDILRKILKLINNSSPRFSNLLLGVWKSKETLFLVFDILLKNGLIPLPRLLTAELILLLKVNVVKPSSSVFKQRLHRDRDHKSKPSTCISVKQQIVVLETSR